MPNKMGDHIQAIVIGRHVFVGGGLGVNEATVMVYSLETGTWTTLPPYQSQFFGMSAVDNKLVLVGGVSTSSGKVTNVLGVWNEQSQTWTHPFPMMPTARHSPSVIAYQKWLVVAGGRDERGSYYKSVEILDTISGQWYEGSPLPNGCSQMSSAVNRNMWYLLGGYTVTSRRASKQVFSVCLDELVSQAVAHSTGTTSLSMLSPWQTLPETLLTHSSALILNGALLAVGGWNSPAIHLYQPSSRRWVEVSDLPDQRSRCACIVLPSGEIFIAGGYTGIRYINSVYISTIV